MAIVEVDFLVFNRRLK